MMKAIIAGFLLWGGYLVARRIFPMPHVAPDGALLLNWPQRDTVGFDSGWLAPDQTLDDAYQVEPRDTVPDQLPGAFASVLAGASDALQAVRQSVGIDMAPAPDVSARNERAFLDMIAYAEGTGGPDGYRMMFGGGLFDSFSDHPRIYHQFTDRAGRELVTSAAGRYQFLARTWDKLQRTLDLPDFGPASQDSAALELIRGAGALRDVQAGRIEVAIRKVAPIWASLPGAGYAQPERSMSSLLAAYAAYGGNREA